MPKSLPIDFYAVLSTIDVSINRCVFAQALEKYEADEIINEHDKLKAKAELFDEQYKELLVIKDIATEGRWNTTQFLASNPPQNPACFHIEHRVESLLAKAKELNNGN